MRPRLSAIGGAVAAVALALGGLVATPTAGGAQTNPFQRGPAPTPQSVTQQRGPFTPQQVAVTGSATLGFNRGTVYYPQQTNQGRYGAIAVIPGFISPEALVAWTGPFLASNGFVVMTIEPFSGFDNPESRASQLDAALRFLRSAAAPQAVRDRIDTTRVGAMGHSMGGGGALELARRGQTPGLEAIVPLQPWFLFPNFSGVRVPSLQVGVSDDFIAPPGSNAEVFYQQIPASSEKAYLEVSAGSHFLGNVFNVEQARSTLAWMKRYIDNDTRYSQFLCPGPSGGLVAEYRQTCPD
jgi:dienelactone hydrolase